MKECGSERVRLAKEVQLCLERFDIQTSSPIIVGASGGKDSTTALLLLRELGLDVIPAIVDLGYEHFRAGEISRYLATLGFEPRILTATGTEQPTISEVDEGLLQGNLRILSDPATTIPCTACTKSKRILLRSYAISIGARQIALGHHKTDIVATLMKDYFVQRYYESCGAYDASAFTSFVSSAPIVVDELEHMIRHESAAGMGVRVRDGDDIELFRPLSLIHETDIVDFTRELQIRTFGSGCSHSLFVEGKIAGGSKREIVHAEIARRFELNPDLEDSLFEMAALSLDQFGFARYNPRGTREVRCPGL